MSPLTYYCMRPYTTSVRALKLVVYGELSY
jgi:hypothetical protein